MNHSIRLHRFRLSGHSHRIELFLSLLGLPFEKVEVELGQGEHKTPAFLNLNRFGQVPVIEDGSLVLADSNAILVYLATAYDPGRRWYPTDPVGAAAVQRWLSVAAGPLLMGPAFARDFEDERGDEAVDDVSDVAHEGEPAAPFGEDHTKDIDFSAGGIAARWEAGYRNTIEVLNRAPWDGEFDPVEGFILHEARTGTVVTAA